MEELQKLYDVLVREGKYSKSFGEFQAKWSQDQAYKEKVYSVVTRDGLYSKDKDSFLRKYTATEQPVKKKVIGESDTQTPPQGTTELPSEDGSLATQSNFKITPEEPTDMSGKPLLPKDNETKKMLGRIYKESQALEAEKKKFGDAFDKQLNIKPKVSESQYLKDRLSSVNADLINREEEYVVPQLQYQFGDLGFNFEETGATGDYVKVTAPNGNIAEISLDNLFDSKSKAQSDVLQKFIKDNTPAKGLFVLEKTMREQDKKFNSDKQIDDSVKIISNEVTSLNTKQKDFLLKKSSFEKALQTFSSSTDKDTIDLLEKERLALNEEMKSILQEEETIKQKSKKLDMAVGKYSVSKSKQGTWGGAIWNAINEGISSISAGTTSLTTDIAAEILPSGYGMSPKDLKDVSINIANKIGIKAPSPEQTVEQWKATLTEDQLDKWEDEVDDYTKKDIKSKTLPYIRIGNREILGDKDTAKQFSDLKEQGFWGGAILGVAKSLPAMIGSASTAGWIQRTAQMYAQISDALAVEMEDNPEFENITENEKLAITLPIGITSAVLEAYGLRNVMASKGVINSITMSVLGKVGKGATAKTFRELVENEVESKLARGLLTITAAGLAEFETGAAQELTETGFKALYNEVKEKGMFKTPNSISDLIENVAVAGAQEAVGGFVLGVPSGISAAYSKKGFLKMDDASFETFANIANDDKMQSAYIASLKDKITQGLITQKEAKEQLNDYRNSVGLYRQLPDGLTTQQKKEAMNLLKEKRDLENYVNGKDNALVVKQKNRITEIDNELTKLSETDAVQEPTTNESVLRTEQPEVELQGVVEGNAKPEGLTAEKEITNAKPKEVKDYKTYFDQDVPNMTVQENNGEFLIGNYTPASEGKNPSMKPVTDLEGNPLTFKTKEEAQAKLDEVQIKPKVEVVATEVTPIETRVEEVITTTQPENKIESVRSNFENGNLQNIEITPTRQGFDGDFLNDYEFLAEGSEHTVYRSKDGKTVVKIGEPYGSNEGFMPRVEDALTISNLIGDGSLEVIGYYESNGVKNPIYQQNYIDGKTMTQEEVASHLESKGFINLGNDKFGIVVNGKSYEISDTSDNFIIDNQGNVSAIDAGIMELDENKLTEEQKSKLKETTTQPEEATPTETPTPVVEVAPVADTAAAETPVVEVPKTVEEFITAIDEKANADVNKIGTPIKITDKTYISKIGDTYSVSFPDKRAKDGITKKLNLTKEQAINILNKKIPKNIIESESKPTKAKVESTPVSKAPVSKAPVVKPEPNTDTVEQRVSKIDKAIQALFDRNGKDTTTWVNQADNFDLIALKRAKKALQAGVKDFKIFSVTRSGERFLEMETKFEAPKAETAPVVEPKVEPTPVAKPKTNKKLDEDIAFYQKDVDYYEFRIPDLEEEIKNEAINTKEEVAELNKKIAEVKADKSLSREQKKEAVEDLKYEIENTKENQQDTINELKDDLKEAKAEQKKSQKKLDALKEKRNASTEVKSEIDELLDLNATDEKALKKASDFLGSVIDDIDRIGTYTGANTILLKPIKVIIQAIKALVDAGYSLQQAIEKVAEKEKITQKQIKDGINSVAQIVPIEKEFNELMDKVQKLVTRRRAKGINEKQVLSELDKMVRESDVYRDKKTTDPQKKIMEREARNIMGVAPKRAVSIGRVIGALNDIKNVSREEKLKIIGRIRELSRDAVKDLKEEINSLVKGGKITPTQAVNIISRFGKVNMLNEISVSNFVDYMAKVFNDADYDNKINVAKKRLKNAKKNIATKIGIANGLAAPLQTLFSINPSLIPIKNLERYIELVDMFSERKAVLQLDEISQVINDVNEILDEIDNELSVADELSFRLNYSDNKIIEDGKLDYAATIKNMVKKGEITQEEAEIMSKYKSEIIPQVETDKKTDEEIAEERAELEKELKQLTVNSSDLPTRDERIVAKRIAQYLSTPFIKQLSNAELKNLIKAIDNINNGYLPHQAELILEKLDGLSDGKTIANSIKKANLKTIAQLVNRAYNTIKSKIRGKETVFEMIKRTPLFNIDQILGDFKTEELYYALLGKVAKAEAKFSFELKTIQDKLQKAQDKVLKSFGSNPLKLKESNYKIRAYQLQLENDSNPGDKRVNPAAEYIKETIKHIKKLESQYNENDIKILEDILKEFAPDGQIDIDKLYNSFNSAEKAAIEVMQEIKKSETEMAEFTGAVIRGKRIVPLNNHTHISVLGDNSKEDLDVGVSFANEYNESLKPSTKAKNLMERTPGAKAINFDPYSTALKSVKYVLLDYNLTALVRTARKAIKASEVELQKDGEMSKEQRRIFNSVRAAFELAVSDLVNNSYVQTSTSQDVFNFISKQGYRSVLAGLGKSGVELISNLGFVVFDPFTFYKGVENMGILLSEDGPAIMNNSNSIQTNRVYASGMSGRMLDLGILDQSVGTKSSKTRGKIINKAQQIWNLTGKKFIKNPIELTADALISSPDKVVMRPYWLGSYITELEKQLGRKVTNDDLKKIAENDEVFMNENEVAIENATQVADRKSKLMGATKNGFAGLLRGKTRVEDSTVLTIGKNFNSFMTNFMVYEFNAAKTGIMAAVGQGTMTKKEGAAVLAGVITRMTVYNLLIKSVSAGFSGLIGSALGFEDDEEEEEKTVEQLTTQALASTFATLMTGRDFGNISKSVINYGFEEYVTKEYLEGLRTGEYDPYKDAILFNSLQRDEKTGEMKIWENAPNFMGSYGPMAKTVALGVKSLSANDKKTDEAIERQQKERTIRLPLEILGNLGYVPLYKEIRKSVMDDIYKGLRTKESDSGITKEELKKLDPEMYQIMYGND